MRPDLPKRQKNVLVWWLGNLKNFQKQSIMSQDLYCLKIKSFERYVIDIRPDLRILSQQPYSSKIKTLKNMRSTCDPMFQNVKKCALLGARKP